MNVTLVGLKEEIKQKDESLQNQREAYEKLTEEFCILYILSLLFSAFYEDISISGDDLRSQAKFGPTKRS